MCYILIYKTYTLNSIYKLRYKPSVLYLSVTAGTDIMPKMAFT